VNVPAAVVTAPTGANNELSDVQDIYAGTQADPELFS